MNENLARRLLGMVESLRVKYRQHRLGPTEFVGMGPGTGMGGDASNQERQDIINQVVLMEKLFLNIHGSRDMRTFTDVPARLQALVNYANTAIPGEVAPVRSARYIDLS